MAKPTFTLIVPTIVEQQLTGFLGAIEKTYRGATYRVEFHPASIAITKDSKKVRAWDDVPTSVQKAARSGREILTASLKGSNQ